MNLILKKEIIILETKITHKIDSVEHDLTFRRDDEEDQIIVEVVDSTDYETKLKDEKKKKNFFKFWK